MKAIHIFEDQINQVINNKYVHTKYLMDKNNNNRNKQNNIMLKRDTYQKMS